MRRSGFAIVCLVVAAGVAGCGSSSGPSTESACDALTVAQITRVTGWTVAEGTADTVDSKPGCIWIGDDRSGDIAVTVGAPGSDASFDDRLGAAGRKFGSASAVDIPGASRAEEFGDFGLVVMSVGGRIVELQMLGLPESGPQHRQLAELVAEGVR